MYKYLVLNGIIVGAVVIVGLLLRLPLKTVFNRQGLILIGALLLLTVIGDNAILGLHIVDYDSTHILGVYLGQAPIEDFSYALLAAVLVPLLWERGAKK